MVITATIGKKKMHSLAFSVPMQFKKTLLLSFKVGCEQIDST